MAEHLAKYQWRYIVVDIQWYEPNAQGHDYRPGAPLTMDEYGRLMPAVNRFPSAANGAGFKPLADYVHSKELKFGIHIMRGIPRQAVAKNLPIKGTPYHAADIADKANDCRWNPDMWGVDTTKSGSQAYYDSIADLYASWGVDFIKADDMGSHLYQPAEIKALSLAIRKTGRPMVLSISPGPAPIAEAEFFERYAQMWRISDDFWDDWKLLRQQFDYAQKWAPFVGKNDTWPDADMLPLGKLRVTSVEGGGAPTKFTPNEQQTVMTLWSIVRSPLIFGGDLPSNDEATTALITNEEGIDVDQHSRGGYPVLEKGICTRGWQIAPDREKDTSQSSIWAKQLWTSISTGRNSGLRDPSSVCAIYGLTVQYSCSAGCIRRSLLTRALCTKSHPSSGPAGNHTDYRSYTRSLTHHARCKPSTAIAFSGERSTVDSKSRQTIDLFRAIPGVQSRSVQERGSCIHTARCQSRSVLNSYPLL
jgi:Alpha galactosidase A